MISRDVITEDQIVTIYKSQTFPTTGFGTAHNLTPELKEKIRNAFLNFEWAGTSLEAEFEKSNEGQFMPMTYKEFWEVIRKIDTANGVSYACE
jgi:phosphonate transport system substrate-binding protein